MIWLNLLHYIKDYLFQKDLRTSLAKTIGEKHQNAVSKAKKTSNKHMIQVFPGAWTIHQDGSGRKDRSCK